MFNKSILRKVSCFALLLSGLSYALEIRPAAGLLFPAETKIQREEKGVKTERSTDTGLMLQGGIELLTWSEYSPFRYGIGLGYNGKQRDGRLTIAPAGIPLWLSFAFGSVDKFNLFSPYAALRVGYVFPISTDGDWWERPRNFTINGGLGCIFPFGIGLEATYDYISMLKRYESKHQDFRVSSGRFGVQLSVGFELSYARKARQEIYKRSNRETEDTEIVSTNETVNKNEADEKIEPAVKNEAVDTNKTASKNDADNKNETVEKNDAVDEIEAVEKNDAVDEIEADEKNDTVDEIEAVEKNDAVDESEAVEKNDAVSKNEAVEKNDAVGKNETVNKNETASKKKNVGKKKTASKKKSSGKKKVAN